MYTSRSREGADLPRRTYQGPLVSALILAVCDSEDGADY